MLNSVYNPAQNFWRERYFLPYGYPGDDMFKGTSNVAEDNAMDDYLWTTTNSYVSQKWAGPYQSITRANMVLEGIENFREGAFKTRVVAETKFLRGMFYFLLVRTFGKVPLVTSYESVDFFPRQATIPEVYQQIVSDLEAAEQGLPGWKQLSPGETGRATRGAAKAFLGKVYLTMATTPETADPKYFSLAAEKLKNIIDTEGYGLIASYKKAFEPQNGGKSEDIFSIHFKANVPNLNGFIHGRMSPNPDIYGIRGTNTGGVTDFVYEKFEAGDARKATIVKGNYTVTYFDAAGAPIRTEVRKTSNNNAYCQKFLDPDTGRFSHNQANAMWPLIRYADVLLMYAEAVNEAQEPNADAYNAIDMVRERSGASLIARGLDKAAFRRNVRDERLLELFAEGHRWFDLKRWGILEEQIKLAKPYAQVQPKHYYFPIPQSEMDVNPNLEQNKGY